MSDKKAEKAEEARRQQEDREKIAKGKEEISLLIDGLSDEWKNMCFTLLWETGYVLMRSSITMDDKEEQAKVRRVVSIIKFWDPWDRRDCLNRLCTKYNIAQTFSKTSRDAEDEDEEFEIMCENWIIDREDKKRKKEEKKNMKKEKKNTK